MTRWLFVAVALAGCFDDTDYAGTVMLSVSGGGSDTRLEGNGILCGPSPLCNGTVYSTCSVALDHHTQVSIEAFHPVCVSGPAPAGYQWTGPCHDPMSSRCSFDIDLDTTITVSLLGTTP